MEIFVKIFLLLILFSPLILKLVAGFIEIKSAWIKSNLLKLYYKKQKIELEKEKQSPKQASKNR